MKNKKKTRRQKDEENPDYLKDNPQSKYGRKKHLRDHKGDLSKDSPFEVESGSKNLPQIREWMKRFILDNDVQTVQEVAQAYKEEFNIEDELKVMTLESVARLAFADSIM